jgi:hypothetical protein
MHVESQHGDGFPTQQLGTSSEVEGVGAGAGVEQQPFLHEVSTTLGEQQLSFATAFSVEPQQPPFFGAVSSFSLLG